MLSQISSNNYIYTDSSSYVAGANLYSSQPQSIGSIGRPDCELEITYFNARSILPKLNELRLLCADSSAHVGCIVETWLDDSVFDNGLTVSSYCLVRIDRNTHSGILLCIKDLSYNVTYTGPENLELLGITLRNGNCNCFCLCTLIVHLPQLILYYNSCLFFTES